MWKNHISFSSLSFEGDDVTFTYTPDPSCSVKWMPSFIVRQNDNEDMLSSTTPQIINATNNKCSVRIDKDEINIKDATYIQKYVNGSISSFPCEK